MQKRGSIVQPRRGQSHGLFGVKFLKHHNFRDSNWTADDLISQYEKLSNIYKKANRNDQLQREQDEIKVIEEFNRSKEESKQLQEKLNVLLKGDVQRTKNVLQDNIEHQRKYKNRQSYELKEELELQSFLKRNLSNKALSEREQLIRRYEKDLMEVAFEQEMMRYNTKQSKAEIEANELFAPLKDSETRTRAIQKEIACYKRIIDQLLHDAIYYQPVLDALNSDWNEQTQLVEQTYNIGLPAIKNVKTLGDRLKKLQNISKKEENKQQKDYFKSLQILEAFPTTIKKLIRSPSDFSILGDRYERKTVSMMNLKTEVENIEQTMKMLKEATKCRTYDEIVPRMKNQSNVNIKLRQQIDKQKKSRTGYVKKEELLKLTVDLMLDDCPKIYNNELQNEVEKLEKSIGAQKKQQKKIENRSRDFGATTADLRYGIFHIVDVLRHVQSADFMQPLEYPTVDLRLPLLRANAPPVPSIINPDLSKLLENIKTISQSLMPLVIKAGNSSRAVTKFQQAVLEDTMLASRPV